MAGTAAAVLVALLGCTAHDPSTQLAAVGAVDPSSGYMPGGAASDGWQTVRVTGAERLPVRMHWWRWKLPGGRAVVAYQMTDPDDGDPGVRATPNRDPIPPTALDPIGPDTWRVADEDWGVVVLTGFDRVTAAATVSSMRAASDARPNPADPGGELVDGGSVLWPPLEQVTLRRAQSLVTIGWEPLSSPGFIDALVATGGDGGDRRIDVAGSTALVGAEPGYTSVWWEHFGQLFSVQGHGVDSATALDLTARIERTASDAWAGLPERRACGFGEIEALVTAPPDIAPPSTGWFNYEPAVANPDRPCIEIRPPIRGPDSMAR
jgi:hypothetical protein